MNNGKRLLLFALARVIVAFSAMGIFFVAFCLCIYGMFNGGDVTKAVVVFGVGITFFPLLWLLNRMEERKPTTVVRYEGFWYAEIDGCVGQAKTEEQAINRAREGAKQGMRFISSDFCEGKVLLDEQPTFGN